MRNATLEATLLVLGLLLPTVGPVLHGRVLQSSPGSLGRANTWSATTSTGRTFTGTWTAVADSKTGHVTGTWTLLDAQGRTVARGGWSAAKTPGEWTGRWRATVSGRNAEYSGTWSAKGGLQANAPLADLFAKAVQDVVSGRWRAGRQSGAWTIRAVD